MKAKLFLTFFLGIITFEKVNCQPDTSLFNLNKTYVTAQTKNQLSQAEYYANQSHSINSQWLTLFGALGGSMIGFLGALIIAKVNKKSESQKFDKQLGEEKAKNLKIAASDLMKKTAEGFHSITWVLWIAKNTPNECSSKIIDDHDKRMNKIYAEIAGAQVVLSAYSKKIYQDTEPIVRHLYHCDGELGRTAYGLKTPATVSATITQLGNMWQGVYDYSLDIPKIFANSMELTITQKAGVSQ
ncbi:MAG: hypothetical protein JST86_03565 [Bacteroidetes bacterium]|nr:hypothetical protein [Bacteroidota bacterium]